MDDPTPAQDFSNQVIDPASLPPFMDLPTEPVSPRYRVLNLALIAGGAALLLLVLSVLRWQPWLALPSHWQSAYPLLVTVIAGVASVLFGYHWLADKRIRFCVREQDLVLQKGLIFKQIACQPILRVQHIELKRGPFERLAGLATLQVFSAGGAMHTFEIPGLPLAQAQQLRQFILNHKELDAK